MYFMRVKNKIRNAMIAFCQMQPSVWNIIPQSEVEALVDSAFATLNKFKGVKLEHTPAYGFVLESNDKNTEKSMRDINENAVICCSGVLLGGFHINEFTDSITGTRLTSRYELFYDSLYDAVRLVYCVDVSGENLTAYYRTENFTFEKFGLYEFIRSITVQISDMLEKSSSAKKRTYNRKKKEEV